MSDKAAVAQSLVFYQLHPERPIEPETDYQIRVNVKGWAVLTVNGKFVASTDNMDHILDIIRVWHKSERQT
jgi:hypothetical protein